MSTATEFQHVLDGLNPAQENAVRSPLNVVQILAPPGSGKTKTLASRVSWLLKFEGYLPWNIVCLTFTIKSAREMQERIAKQIESGLGSKLILGTFHSVCLRYLRHYGQLIGLPKGFGVADTSDTKAIILRIIKRLKLTIDTNVAKNRISKCKARNETWLDVQNKGKKGVDQQEFQMLYEAYQDTLEAANLLDYDDLLMLCARLLQRHPECVSNVDAVLIDEFQDTNNVQFMLMSLFAQYKKRITTVGDPDQSIYGWRSAEIRNLERMRDLFSDIHVIHLEDNYRSSGAILRAAQEVIEQDASRPQKSLQATHCRGTKPVLRMLSSSETEAQWTVAEMKRCMALTGGNLLTHSDFAILIRSASQSRQLELAMGNAAIPYRMVGGLRFFDRAEVKILLDYLRIVSHTGNSDAIARVLNVPPRGIGKDTSKELLEEASATGRSLWDIIRDTVQGTQRCRTKISRQAERGIEMFFALIEASRKKLAKREEYASLRGLLEHIIRRLDFRRYLEKMYPEDTENVRGSNVDQLLAQASDADEASDLREEDPDALPELDAVEQQKIGNLGEEALSRFLSNVALATEHQTKEQADTDGRPIHRVTLSTMHAAKGLEWPIVFVPSAYHGSIPHSRAEDHDEERRLLYVAMTRAQALLYISCPTRNTNGEETTLSPFLDAKEVRSCFVSQGPSLHADRVFDICKILRRAVPTYDDLVDAERTTQSPEDDEYRWPLDGSIGAQDVSKLQSRFGPFHPIEPIGKRLKLSHAPRANVVFMRQHSSHPKPSSNLGGFMSASSQLWKQQTEAGEVALKSGSSASQSAAALPQSRRKLKLDKTQSTLTGLWLDNTQEAVGGVDLRQGGRASGFLDIGPGQKFVTGKSDFWQERELRPKGQVGSSCYKMEAVGFRAEMSELVDTNPGKLDRSTTLNSARSIPETLMHHTIKPGPSLKRCVTGQEAISSRKRRIWAPTMADAPGLDVERPLREVAQEPTMGPATDRAVEQVKFPDGVRPVSTHKTTMSKLQEQDSLPKKTLGVRRSTASWGSRVSRQFKVPHSSLIGGTSPD